MPTFEYVCPKKHITEAFRPVFARNRPMECGTCQRPATLRISAPHVPGSGIYSYAPNIGSEENFARRIDAIKEGKRVIAKKPD